MKAIRHFIAFLNKAARKEVLRDERLHPIRPMALAVQEVGGPSHADHALLFKKLIMKKVSGTL